MACIPRRSNGRGRGRGVLALKSYEPCPRPSPETIGKWHQTKSAVTPGTEKAQNASYGQSNSQLNLNNEKVNIPTSVNNTVISNGHQNVINQTNQGSHDIRIKSDNQSNKYNEIKSTNNTSSNCDMIAKYKYKAKPGKPGGFEELSIKQGEKLILVNKGHAETNNPHWWEVINEQGNKGFVPAKWCLLLEKTPTVLPWLENKRLLEEEQSKKRQVEISKSGGSSSFGAPVTTAPQIKGYVSAYSTGNVAPARTTVEASKQYFCEICDKNLNGPQPYKMHMSSKAHREEVEYQNSKNQN